MDDNSEYILGLDTTDSPEAQLVDNDPEQLKQQIDDLVVDKENLVQAIREIKSAISEMMARELDNENKDFGTDHHTEAEEELSCLEAGSAEVRPFTTTVAGSTATITSGILQIGTINYEVPSYTVTLAGATEYIYVYHKKDHSSSGFGHSSTLPNSAGDEWRFIIAKYAASGSTWVEVWSNSGNVIAIAPTA